MKTEHSQLPWRVDHFGFVCDAQNHVVAETYYKTASMIVTSINSHQALVEACEAAINHLAGKPSSECVEESEADDYVERQLRSALKLAEKE